MTENQNPTGIFIPQTLNIMQMSLLPSYRGEGGTPLKEFLERLEEAATQFGWSDTDKFFVIKNKLFDEAREIVNENKDIAINFDEVVGILKKHFDRGNSLGVDLFNFMAFKQPINMPVERFIAQANLKSKSLNFGAASTGAAEKQRQHLLFNMLSSNIKPEILRGVLARDPKTVEELKNFAILEERAIKLTAGSLNPFLQPMNEQIFLAQQNQPNTNLEQICEKLASQVDMLTEKLERLEKTQEKKWERGKSYPRKDKKELICYRCNMPGHIARYCRTKLDENPEAALN